MKEEIRKLIMETLEEDKENPDYKEADKLIFKLKDKNYLSKNDLIEISKWKLMKQYNRNIRNLEKSFPIIETITKHLFSIKTEIEDLDQRIKDTLLVRILSSLEGIGIGITSAILALKYPKKYGVIDFRVWSVLSNKPFNKVPKSNKRGQRIFSIGDYLRYLDEIRKIAKELGIDVQKVDWALWKIYDLSQMKEEINKN